MNEERNIEKRKNVSGAGQKNGEKNDDARKQEKEEKEVMVEKEEGDGEGELLRVKKEERWRMQYKGMDEDSKVRILRRGEKVMSKEILSSYYSIKKNSNTGAVMDLRENQDFQKLEEEKILLAKFGDSELSIQS